MNLFLLVEVSTVNAVESIPALLEELQTKAEVYRKNIADAEAAMAATWNPAMKQRLQERIDATRAKLAAVEAQLTGK